ncbi:MAG: DEAD/DEAH box helicase family protein [Candidatus Hydrogenedentes bacterium]|nr:DEAD/DEAH box helicase family protein [Candidatus Hydrogenedentota bacterium]
MSGQGPKGYQEEAVRNVLEIFRYAESQIQLAPDAASRAAASAYNGCALLEAPTGSGKTRMAGLIAEAFSRPDRPDNAKIVWFWFTPFAGLVEQSEAVFKADFVGLRVRDLLTERVTASAKSGDLFVTTWASVAAARKDTRVLRSSGDTSLALDDFIPELREDGFRIGVVVDEAHHGFTKATEAVKFYRDVMRPDFTLLVTATPNDQDIERFKEAAGIQELHRISVSRKDAVDAALIKDGIKSIAYIAPDDQRALLDFGLTAIADAWQMHGAIKKTLAGIGINLTPLMLVQVGNSDKAVDEAKTRLQAAGVPASAIAWYTSEDPNDDLLVVAKDESKEVLIFKVAVALGFDAPRAFTLVSLRGAKDTDFGIQVVGRILRVHARLQPRALDKTLPDLLRYGYVFLADAENQTGLTSAGEKINSIQTELSKVSPYTMVVSVAGKNEVQVTQNGQTSLVSVPYAPAPFPPLTAQSPSAPTFTAQAAPTTPGLLTSLILNPPPSPLDVPSNGSQKTSAAPSPLSGNRNYAIRAGIPRLYKTEQLPLSTDDLLRCVKATIGIDDKVFGAGLRESVKVTKKSVDIFDADKDAEITAMQARLSDYEIARRANGVLFDAEYLHPKQLHEALMERLQAEFEHRGIPAEGDAVEKALNRIMATYPNILRKAARQCSAKYKEVVDADQSLPESVEWPVGTPRSSLNIYGIVPQDLNEPERKFAGLLDADTSGTVEYWFRNETRKPWSIAIVLPNGYRYFPDFGIKVKGRTKGDGILLLEIKGDHILNGADTLEKVVASHGFYGSVPMLMREPDGRYVTIKYDEKTDKNFPDQIFRIENLAGF